MATFRADRGTLKYAIVALGVIGTFVTWGRTALDGTLDHCLNALETENFILPGTDTPLRRRFIGLYPVDYLLRTLVVFFWEAAQGSRPDVTVTGIYFVGQLFPVIAAIFLDNLRRGNGNSTLKPALWFMVFGAAAIGCSGAAWALLYVSNSPLTSAVMGLEGLQRTSMIHSPISATLLLPAEVIGYVVPVILMGLPSPTVVSVAFQQWAIVIWNTFPLIMHVIIQVGKPFVYRTIPFPKAAYLPSNRIMHMSAIRQIGIVSCAIGFIMHISVVAVCLSATLFAPLFNPSVSKHLNLLALATPPIGLTKGDTVGAGIWSFMIWDQVVGFALVMVVYLTQLRNVLRFEKNAMPFDWTIANVVCVFSSLLVGPGTTVMLLSWTRDELLFNLPTKEHYGQNGIVKH